MDVDSTASSDGSGDTDVLEYADDSSEGNASAEVTDEERDFASSVVNAPDPEEAMDHGVYEDTSMCDAASVETMDEEGPYIIVLDATDVAPTEDTGDEDPRDSDSGVYEETSMGDAASVEAMDEDEPFDDIFDAADAASIEATGDEDPDDSDSSLDYENFGECVNQATIVSEEGEPEARYTSVSFYDTEVEVEQARHRLNEFVYSYKTRYISRFRVGKEFSCCSHNGW